MYLLGNLMGFRKTDHRVLEAASRPGQSEYVDRSKLSNEADAAAKAYRGEVRKKGSWSPKSEQFYAPLSEPTTTSLPKREPTMTTPSNPYPARLEIDYPERLDRLTTFFRLIWALPIVLILTLLTATGNETVVNEANERLRESGGGIVAGLFLATMLMIVFRQRYPRWWFDFALELNRFSTRVGSYLALLTDRYPSTSESQSVHLEIDYPDVEQDLNRFLPLVKWLLAIPHYLALVVLVVGAIVAIVVAWFAILFTGRYPRGLFDYVVGVGRWGIRVQAYATLLVTDRYPPFSLT
jgi:hypothetical protein